MELNTVIFIVLYVTTMLLFLTVLHEIISRIKYGSNRKSKKCPVIKAYKDMSRIRRKKKK